MKLNITSKLLSLFVTTAVILTSCSDKDDDVSPVTDTACKITSLSVETILGTGGGTIEYNANGMVSKTISHDSNSDYTLFKYDGQNRLVREEEYVDGELDYYTVYTYANGRIAKGEWFWGDDTPDGYMTLKYDGSNRVTEVNEIYEEEYEGEVYAETYTVKHTYNNQGNISKSVYFMDDEEDYTITYDEYDNKFTPAVALKGIFDPWTGFSKNNPLKATVKFIIEGEPQTTVSTYTYTYNSNNLPTKITQTSAMGNLVSDFTYQCN